MAATENTSLEMQQSDPVRAAFDMMSYWATIWGFVGLCLWVENRLLTNLDIPKDGVQLGILVVSTPVIFLLTMKRVNADARARTMVNRLRYVVILVAAAFLGAYIHATHKDQSYEGRLRDGAFIACAKMAACKESAAQYANAR